MIRFYINFINIESYLIHNNLFVYIVDNGEIN